MKTTAWLQIACKMYLAQVGNLPAGAGIKLLLISVKWLYAQRTDVHLQAKIDKHDW